MIAWVAVVSAVLYLAAAALLGRRLAGGVEAQGRSRTAPLLLAATAVVGHILLLYQTLMGAGGLDLAFFNVLSLTTWMICALVVITALGQPIENLGIGLFPLAAVAIALQLLVPEGSTIVNTGSAGMQAHIMLSILSASLFTIAAFQAGLLAMQDRHLRNRHPGGFIRALPPLQTMEALLFRMIGIGYVLLSLALITGATYIHNIFAQHLVHKTVLSIAAWAVFAILLWGRWQHGWRGRTAIRWTLGGFTALLLAYFGSKLVQELILGR